MIRLYKILTFLLQPVGFMILMSSASSLLASTMNPQFLLVSAIGICIFLYTFFSFRFSIKAVIGNQPVKAKLKDWIKVNSYVTLIQAIFVLFLVIMVLYFVPADLFKSTFRSMYDMLQEQPGQQNFGTFPEFLKSMRVLFGVMGVVELLLAVHVILTWRMLKGYREYFQLK